MTPAPIVYFSDALCVSANAALASDNEAASAMNIQGSPSFVLNEGRQKLYGQVGYRILEANIQALRRAQPADQAGWY